MPDYNSDFFLFFFRLQSSHWSVHFLQSWAEHLRPSPPKANFTPKGPPFHFLLFQGNIQNRTCPKGPPFGFFSALCDFFPKFFCLQRVPPFIFYFFNVTYKTGRASRVPLWVFWYFATECLLINPEGSPLLHFSALCDFFWKKKFFQKFQFFSKKSVLRFLSLRYGADFRRSRLVLQILPKLHFISTPWSEVHFTYCFPSQ